MAKAKDIVSVLRLSSKEYDPDIGLRCVDTDNKLVDVDLDKIHGVCMSTIWYIEREELYPKGDQFVTERELKSNKLVRDGSKDKELIDSVIKLLQYDKMDLNKKGTKEESCFHVTGRIRNPSRGFADFEGYILAPNRSFAANSTKAFYMQTRNLGLTDVDINVVKPVKMQNVFSPMLKYYEISLD